ncbi:hypothetical protein B0T16DRAFT_399167 [Cercophora newfieldiana]|uniref:Uncharacterized protein n=1 Tax=Cercophora newfieldiana TaxID=92897 RepID=A0AA39YQN9_9PEZI|nr:hypothetical protein B0T16DRAFT_399167 [Cercophora newfieldiana]
MVIEVWEVRFSLYLVSGWWLASSSLYIFASSLASSGTQSSSADPVILIAILLCIGSEILWYLSSV